MDNNTTLIEKDQGVTELEFNLKLRVVNNKYEWNIDVNDIKIRKDVTDVSDKNIKLSNRYISGYLFDTITQNLGLKPKVDIFNEIKPLNDDLNKLLSKSSVDKFNFIMKRYEDTCKYENNYMDLDKIFKRLRVWDKEKLMSIIGYYVGFETFCLNMKHFCSSNIDSDDLLYTIVKYKSSEVLYIRGDTKYILLCKDFITDCLNVNI